MIQKKNLYGIKHNRNQNPNDTSRYSVVNSYYLVNSKMRNTDDTDLVFLKNSFQSEAKCIS